MSFLYPSFLWALAAIAVPIIIHLLNLQRSVKLEFSSIQFLQQLKKETASKQKIKHWLILLSRCLFIVFLVFAFCQPFLKSSDDVQYPTDYVIYIDNSLSMENQPNSEVSALEEAKQLAIKWVETNQIVGGISLLTNTSSQHYQASKNLIDAITKVQLESQEADFSSIQRKIGEPKEGKKVVLLSDFQQSSFPQLEALVNDSLSNFELVVLNQGAEPNIFIDSVWLKKEKTSEQLNSCLLYTSPSPRDA